MVNSVGLEEQMTWQEFQCAEVRCRIALDVTQQKHLDNRRARDSVSLSICEIKVRCSVRKSFTSVVRQAVVLLVTLVFLAVSTAALAHGHAVGKSAEESRCALCMAVHSTTHVVAGPVVMVHFVPIQTALFVSSDRLVLSSAQSLPTQGRAPPQL
jgi:hypothetical protein